MKEKVRKEHYHRILMVLKSELNSANKQEAINTLVVPVRMRRIPPMPEEQRPKPNTTVTNSSGQEWESKALHGKYPQRVKQADVDQDKTHRWLKAAGLKAETEGFIIAAQDQSLLASWYQHNILWKPEEGPKCRLCGRFDETIDILICKEFGIEVKERWY
ncbi:unnamed protein product [Porites evermanni]|uniref:Uncharacterized protein n=1 Tax=Porites evermanni TaxID=104178 RepID=A0ABN8Q3I9_9CNID|nr:unnamed protein product [Porites evermanni]